MRKKRSPKPGGSDATLIYVDDKTIVREEIFEGDHDDRHRA
jgi:hypothetical protein